MSVNGISRFMGSVCLGPKVIPLSGAHCILFTGTLIPKGWDVPVKTMLCLYLLLDSKLTSIQNKNFWRVERVRSHSIRIFWNKIWKKVFKKWSFFKCCIYSFKYCSILVDSYVSISCCLCNLHSLQIFNFVVKIKNFQKVEPC